MEGISRVQVSKLRIPNRQACRRHHGAGGCCLVGLRPPLKDLGLACPHGVPRRRRCDRCARAARPTRPLVAILKSVLPRSKSSDSQRPSENRGCGANALRRSLVRAVSNLLTVLARSVIHKGDTNQRKRPEQRVVLVMAEVWA